VNENNRREQWTVQVGGKSREGCLNLPNELMMDDSIGVAAGADWARRPAVPSPPAAGMEARA